MTRAQRLGSSPPVLDPPRLATTVEAPVTLKYRRRPPTEWM